MLVCPTRQTRTAPAKFFDAGAALLRSVWRWAAGGGRGGEDKDDGRGREEEEGRNGGRKGSEKD
eukprot:767140-Hanusia_phi.AAC.4